MGAARLDDPRAKTALLAAETFINAKVRVGRLFPILFLPNRNGRFVVGIYLILELN